MQVEQKIFEVDSIICRRQHKGEVQYLVTWKGYSRSTATWEPIDNLFSCGDLISQFHRKANPIPGADPYIIQRIGDTKKVHVKMLLTRKSKYKRGKSGDYIDTYNFTSEGSMLNNKVNNKRSSESEKLIRDTLLHESKTMEHRRTSLNKINLLMNGFDDVTPYNGVSNLPSSRRVLVRNNVSKNEDLVFHTVEKGYMKITLNNTEQNNVLTIEMLETLCHCLHKATKNTDIKAVVITNTGDYFCSGFDYSNLISCTVEKDYKVLVTEVVACLRNFLYILLLFPKPLICAVNGPVLELGVAIVVAADITYGSSKASFDLLYSQLGLTPVGCLTQYLPKIVGRAMAHSMMYMSGRYNAVTAHDRGLILQMYGVNSFEEDISKALKSFTSSSSQVLQSVKRLVNHLDPVNIKHICDEELEVFMSLLLTKECRTRLLEDWRMLVNLHNLNF